MEIENQNQFDSLKSRAFELIYSFMQCCKVFLTDMHCSFICLRCWKVATKSHSGPEKNQSKAWLHFMKTEDSSASKNICRESLLNKGRNRYQYVKKVFSPTFV